MPRVYPGKLMIGISLMAAGLALSSCQRQAQSPAEESAASALNKPADDAALIERGKYLVTIGGCNDCHTPWKIGDKGPEPDMSRMLSGHPENSQLPAPAKLPNGWMASVAGTFTAWSGPWGISYTANLTPDENTGIGIWDEAMFFKTIREGRHMANGRPLLPPMPWFNYAKMTDDDLRAVFRYLKSIPPIHNRVPDPVIVEPPPPAAH